MATLDKIRDKAGCAVLLIGVALLAFVFGDFLRGGSQVKRDKEMNAFVVNGKATKIHDYDAKVRQMSDMLQQQGHSGIDEAQMTQLRNELFQGMVAEQVLEEEAKKLGIAISSAEMFDMIQGEHISPVIRQAGLFNNPETGQFDRLQLVEFLRTIQSEQLPPEQKAYYLDFWANIEKNVRQHKLNEKYTNLVSSAIFTNSLEAEYLAKADANVADIEYVQQTLASADVEVQPTEADIKAYYDSHKDAFYTLDRSALIDLIYVDILPSEKDYADARKDIEDAQAELLNGQSPALVLDDYSDTSYSDMYLTLQDFEALSLSDDLLAFISEANVGEVSQFFDGGDHFAVAKMMGKRTSPESLLVSHILLVPGMMEDQAGVDEILAEAKENPNIFGELAMEYSLDSNSRENGGEIGWLSEAMATQFIEPGFSEAIYAAKVGEPFAYTSRYGEHIVLVKEAKENVEKYNVALAQRNVVASTDTQNAIYSDITAFHSEYKDKDISAEALNAGYQVMDDMRIMASQPLLMTNYEYIQNSRQVIRWAVNQKTGAVSDIMESDGKFIIAVVNEVTPAGYLPLDAVREGVESMVADEMKLDAMYEQLVEAGYADLNTFAEAIDRPVEQLESVKFSTARLADIGYENAINAAAAYAPLNTVVPVKGDRAVYLVKVLDRTAEETATTADEVKMHNNLARRGALRSQALNQVIVNSSIEDYRYKFY